MKDSKALLVFETSSDDLLEDSLFSSMPREARQGLLTALCLDHAERLATGLPAHAQLWFRSPAGVTDARGSDDPLCSTFPCRKQSGALIGERLADAFTSAFDEGGRSVLLVLSHIVASVQRHVREAFTLLDTFDDGIVVGTLNDGSLGILGLRHHARDVLDLLRTTDTLASDTLLRLLPTSDLIILPLATLRNPTSDAELLHLIECSDEEASSLHLTRFRTRLQELHLSRQHGASA